VGPPGNARQPREREARLTGRAQCARFILAAAASRVECDFKHKSEYSGLDCAYALLLGTRLSETNTPTGPAQTPRYLQHLQQVLRCLQVP
jgi:hypothetical protein